MRAPARVDASRRAFLFRAAPRAVTVAPHCLEARGVFCRSCAEACPESAIRVDLRAGPGARVRVDPRRCTACGDCVATCPVSALVLPEPREATAHE